MVIRKINKIKAKLVRTTRVIVKFFVFSHNLFFFHPLIGLITVLTAILTGRQSVKNL